MKLLFDHHLSPKLVRRLADLYPGSDHVFPLGLAEAEDIDIWEHARRESFLIVTKDADFGDLSLLRGFPPKVVWVRRGNCSTAAIERILREHHGDIAALAADEVMGVLTLFWRAIDCPRAAQPNYGMNRTRDQMVLYTSALVLAG